MRGAVFDLDGTLADTSGDLLSAANRCFKALGMGEPLDLKADSATAYAGGRAMLRLGFSRLVPGWTEADIDAEIPVFLKYYEENISVLTRVYPGVFAAIEKLSGRGFSLGICTNKPEYLAQILLQQLGLRQHFGPLLGADTLRVRKPDPEHLFETLRRMDVAPERAVLIGDTVTDRDTARNAGVGSVLVTFGPMGQEIADLKPHALLEHYDDLPELLEEILPL